ncbi:MAG: HugZ family protein [Alphaproteobacteria bacterium]
MSVETPSDNSQRAANARALVRGARTAALSTLLANDGAPYGSMVLSATCPDASPVLLLSKLAVHTQNLLHDPRATLLYDAASSLNDPLTGARLSLVGCIRPIPAEATTACRTRFLARHPSAAAYVDFADFSFYRLAPDRAHLVAGFGQINWIEGADMLLSQEQWAALAEAESDILAHMNCDHADSVALYAHKLLGQAAGPWRMVGCDPEGCDLELAGTLARLPFTAMICTPGQVRQELVRFSQLARTDNPL